MKRLLHHHLENPLPVPLVVGCRFGCSERFACSRRGGMFAGEGIGWFAAKQKKYIPVVKKNVHLQFGYT